MLLSRYTRCCQLLLHLISAAGLWYWNIGQGWSENYHGYLTLSIVGVAFSVVYWGFAKMYQAQKIGIFRLTELAYFQILSFGIADAILYIASVLWFHGFDKLSLISYIAVLAMQMIIIVALIFVCNRLFANMMTRKYVVYGA